MKKILNKFIKLIKNNKLYVLSFIVGIMIIGILYKLNNTTPFGNKSLLCVDFFHQYGPMLGELYDRVHNGSGFIYSFNMALGLPFFRNFLNYLSSPFNIIILFFTKEGLLTSYSFVIGLKAVFANIAMVYYLSKKFNTKELYLIPMGIIYAFSAYFSAYYWNIMWLDGMVFLPLITLGIEYIVDKGKWKFYTIYLAIMLIANYFIGYMICIFSVVYFVIYSVYRFKFKKKLLKKELIKLLKNCFTFGVSSLIAGGLTAFLLLPMASSMASISATGGEMPTTQYYAFEAIDFFKGHLTGTKTTTFASDSITNPNVSCGILSVVLILLYIMNIEIPMKNKICYSLILGLFAFAFFNPQLDYILQAFHVPNDLPYRYSFIYSFVLVVISAYALINVRKVNYIVVATAYIFLLLVLLSISKDNWNDLSENMIYINMIILTLYFIFYSGLYFIRNMDNIFYLSIIAVACIDVVVSINTNWNITQVRDVFYEDYNETKELLNYIENNDDELFYRVEKTDMLTYNDPSWYNYHGITAFSSMNYEAEAKLQHSLGMAGNDINSNSYSQTTPIYDLMFDLKYMIGETNDYDRYLEITRNNKPVNEFTYNVGLGFGVNKDIKKYELNYNPFSNQNNFIEKATGIKDTLAPANLLKTEELYSDNNYTILEYTYENPGDNLYFYSNDYTVTFAVIGSCLYYENDTYNNLLENVNIEYYSLDDYHEERIININSSEENVKIIVGYTNYYGKGFNLYYIDHNKFADASLKLKKNKWNITSFEENNIEGTIKLDDNMDIYTSISYDEGWHAYLDGKEVKTYKTGDALLTIEGSKGEHTLTLKYKTPGLLIGSLISITSLSIVAISTLIDKNIIKLKLKKKKTSV